MSSSSLRGATLLDTGPLVAWFDRSDQDHDTCVEFFQGHAGAFISTWPVLTEVCHLVPTDVGQLDAAVRRSADGSRRCLAALVGP
jgi:predicted nucleic acid-binding protein